MGADHIEDGSAGIERSRVERHFRHIHETWSKTIDLLAGKRWI